MLEAADRTLRELKTRRHPRPPRRPGRPQAGRQVLRVGGAGRPVPAGDRPPGRGGGQGDAGPAHRRQEDAVRHPGAGAHAPARDGRMQQELLEAARTAAGAEQHPGHHQGVVPRLPGAGRRLRVRRLVRRRASARPTSRSRPRPRSACLPDEEFRSPDAPASCMWCGRKAVDGGGVGQGVLMPGGSRRPGGSAEHRPALFADAGLERRGASLLLGGVRSRADRRAGRHARSTSTTPR